MSNLKNSRNLRDALLKTTQALPAAGASANHDSFDLGGEGPHMERFEIEVQVPTLPALVDSETVTIEIEHSTDDSTFTDLGDAVAENASSATVTGSLSQVITGSETPGTPGAVVMRFALPSYCNRYVRVTQAVSASGGDNTGVTVTAYLLS